MAGNYGALALLFIVLVVTPTIVDWLNRRK